MKIFCRRRWSGLQFVGWSFPGQRKLRHVLRLHEGKGKFSLQERFFKAAVIKRDKSSHQRDQEPLCANSGHGAIHVPSRANIRCWQGHLLEQTEWMWLKRPETKRKSFTQSATLPIGAHSQTRDILAFYLLMALSLFSHRYWNFKAGECNIDDMDD